MTNQQLIFDVRDFGDLNLLISHCLEKIPNWHDPTCEKMFPYIYFGHMD